MESRGLLQTLRYSTESLEGINVRVMIILAHWFFYTIKAILRWVTYELDEKINIVTNGACF
jgi:hypothetical protein